jgi:hypothetical protein
MKEKKNKSGFVMKKTFKEFIAAYEYGYDFNKINKDDLKWAENYINSIPYLFKTEEHLGDCTNQPCTCFYCLLQNYLEEYAEYCLDEKNFLEEYQSYRDWLEETSKFWIKKLRRILRKYKLVSIKKHGWWWTYLKVGCLKYEKLVNGYNKYLYDNLDKFEYIEKGNKRFWRNK